MFTKMSTNTSQYWAGIACCIIRPKYGDATPPGQTFEMYVIYFAHKIPLIFLTTDMMCSKISDCVTYLSDQG